MTDSKETVFGEGQVLFRQGEKGGELYFIKSGRVQLTVYNEHSGESAVVAEVGERSVLGTMTFLESEPRSSTATALTEVKCVIVNQHQRQQLLKSIPQWFQVLVKDLSQNLRRLNMEYTKLASENEILKKRLANKERQLRGEGVEDDDGEEDPAASS